MAKGKIFEYAVIYHPAKVEKDSPEQPSELLVDVKRVLASSPQEVSIIAAREIPEKFLSKLADIEIVVRPFFD